MAKEKAKAADKVYPRLDIIDLPSDRIGVLTGVRRPLINAYNKVRDNAEKRKLLKETLQRVIKEL
jgi:hypothetical protein